MLYKEIILVGYSGHGLVVAETAIDSNLNLKHYTEIQQMAINPFELNYLGFEGDEKFEYWNNRFGFILGSGDNKIRRKIADFIISKKGEIFNTISPYASVSKKITIGIGNFIARNAAVNPLASIGNFCILNTGCIVEHECIINHGAHIAPGVVLAGNVAIGENTFVGANSVVKQGISIGSNVVIGAGSVIINDIPDGKKIVGNPGREI